MARSARDRPGAWGTGMFALAALWVHGAAALADTPDLPGRAARLSDTVGAVSLQPAGVTDWIAAPLNRPLTTGDRLWVDEGSRAELDLGDAGVRLGAATDLAFLNFDDAVLQLRLAAGTLVVRVRDVWPGQVYEVDTPTVAVTLEGVGTYRVEVTGGGDQTLVRVDDGAAAIAGAAEAVELGHGRQVRCGGAGTPVCTEEAVAPGDALDDWSAARERAQEEATSANYVETGIPGLEDLDDNGQWQSTAEYGPVWRPTLVSAGWAPYRFGYWAWIAPWGWTWVDDARWGYAPFHYGRWAQWHGGWCWVPGPRRARPVYAPALVAWAGGPGLSTPAAYGRLVSWFPLAPGERYAPNAAATPASSRFVPSVAGVTTVPARVFTSGLRTGHNVLRLPAPLLAEAVVSPNAPALVPDRNSVLGPAPAPAPVRPPEALERRSVVARTEPPRAPAPFARVQAQIEAAGGRPPRAAELASLQPPLAAAPVRVVTSAGPVVPAAAHSPPARNTPEVPPTRATSSPEPAPGGPRSVAAPGLPAPPPRREPMLQTPGAVAAAPNAVPATAPHSGAAIPPAPPQAAPTAPAHSPEPAPGKASPDESRSSAPHGDRESRERVPR